MRHKTRMAESFGCLIKTLGLRQPLICIILLGFWLLVIVGAFEMRIEIDGFSGVSFDLMIWMNMHVVSN